MTPMSTHLKPKQSDVDKNYKREVVITDENGVRYYLLDLQDYLKVYTASSKDGYRRDTKNKNDNQKIELIKQALTRK